jgi:sulfatase maturation enzyme AslB (radical SAM superfamily)
MTRDYDGRKDEIIPAECRSCNMRLICSNCPAWSELETNSLDKKVDYVCEYAKCLEKMFFKRKEKEYEEKVLSEARD